MDLIALVVVALVGFLVWLITTKVPMPSGWAATLQIVALVILVLWLVGHFIALPNVLPSR